MALLNRALFILPDNTGGGAESIVRMLARECARRGWYVKVICIRDNNSTFWESEDYVVDIYSNAVSGLLNFLKTLQKDKYGIVFTSQTQLNALMCILKALRFLRTEKLIIRESTMVYSRFTGLKLIRYKLSHVLYIWSDNVIFQTTDMLRSFEENFFLSSRVSKEVIKNPVKIDFLIEQSVKETLLVTSSNFILAVGRLIEEKGFDILIDAFETISIKYPEISLIIIGDGPLKVKLVERINRYGLSDRVHLTGYLENPYPYMRLASCCVVSSRLEGYPNVLLQMLALNSRVLSTKCAGDLKEIPDLDLVEIDDVNALVSGIDKLLKIRDRELTKLYNQRKVYLNERSVENFIMKLIK